MIIQYRALGEPLETIRCKQTQTNAFIKNQDLGSGTLFVAENAVYWIDDNGQGFTLDYPSISLHAISRDLTCFPCECVYLMLDAEFQGNQFSGNGVAAHVAETDEEEADEDEQIITELRFVPQDKSTLDSIFQALSECQALHPDEEDYFSDEDGDQCPASEQSSALEPSNEISFDEHGQVVFERQPAAMRGVNNNENAAEHGENNGVNIQDGSDIEDMEVGQYDDV